ncbi:hypothetical protein LCGC14_3153420 [marine sediment metagenome]|uniref:Uncharacterized protein n=1 Tax=marine sediment metagenome TaxID=412755 RepID=A0A0F8Y050_9ZZZZ
MSKQKVRMTSTDISEKWGRNLKHSVPDIQKGLDAVTEAPSAKAIEKQEKMLANLTEAVNNGTWAARLGRVSLQEWKEKTKKKVAERMSGGVDGAMGKRKEFDNYLVAELNSVLPEIANMDDLTLEDSVARVRKLMEHMANNPYKKA